MSVETDSLIAYLASTGVPFRVTSTTGGTHVAGSYHYRQGTGGKGLAVDFGGPAPCQGCPELDAIFNAFLPIRPQLAELFGPPNDPVGHDDHVHVAAPLGFSWIPEVPPMPDDPNIPNLTGPAELHLVVSSDGRCTGYYVFSPKTGEIHTWGPGAVYYGRSEVITAP